VVASTETSENAKVSEELIVEEKIPKVQSTA